MPAFAHPLGNFTINRFSQVLVNGDRIDVLYVVDYAEIPTFQEKQRIADDPAYLDRRVRDLAAGLRLDLGPQRMALAIDGHSVSYVDGQGGLQTMRLQILLSAAVSQSGRQAGVYHDTNYAGRLGWKEIVVQQTGGARLLDSSAPTTTVSNALRTYPQDMLTSPLEMTEAHFTFVPTAGAEAIQPRGLGLTASSPAHLITDRFAALITPAHLSLFTLGGSNHPPIVESDMVEPADAFRLGFSAGTGLPDSWAHLRDSGPIFDRLAAAGATTLANMHGSAWHGPAHRSGEMLLEFARRVAA